MAFKVYRPHIGDISNSVNISKTHITISSDLKEKIKTNNVELAYDDEDGIIRIKPSNIGVKIKNGKIGAAGFLRGFKIDVKGKFEANYNDQDQCIYVNIK